MALLRRKRLQDGSLGELEKVFSGETESEKIKRLEDEAVIAKENSLNMMLASTEMYEEQYEKNLDMMSALTDLYELMFTE